MLKRVTVLIVVIVLAKPAYDLAMNILSNPAVEEVTEAVRQIDVNIPMEEAPTTTETAPKTAQSVEQLAEAFSYHFNQLATNFTIEYRGNTSDLEKMLQQATDLASASNPYIAGHFDTREIQYEYTKIAATIHVKQSYLTTPQQEQIVNAIAEQILAKQPIQTMTDYEKVKFVNDYIVKNTIYSEQATASPHSAYAVAQEGRGVCQGYALFAQKLLDKMGIQSLYVTGEVDTGGHAWNLVSVDGQWYHLDTTWNDPVPDRGNEVSYNYFLKNDTAMKADHIWQSADYPKAVSNDYSSIH